MPTTASNTVPVARADGLATAVAEEHPMDDSLTVPAALEADIAFEISARWQVPPEDLALHWGDVRDPKQLDDVTGFRLVGKGVNGWFAVLFDCDDRPAFAARLRVGVRRGIPLARRNLQEGDTILEGDVVYEQRLTWGPPSRQTNGRPGPGWRVTQDISAGQVLAESQTTPAPVVFCGDRVKLTWQRGAVTVILDGLAEHDAGEGRTVTVRLRGRRGTRQGVVTGPNRACLAS